MKLLFVAALSLASASSFAEALTANGCFDLLDPHPVSPARKGILCLYSWLGAPGEGPGGTKVAYVKVDTPRGVAVCGNGQNVKVTASGISLVAVSPGLPDSKVEFVGDDQRGRVSLGRTQYDYVNTGYKFADIYKVFQSDKCK